MKQENYSSTVQQWMEQIMKNRGSNAQVVLHYCDKLQEHGEKVKDCNLLGFAQYYRGETYYLLNYADGMFRNLISAVDNLRQAGVHELEASAYNFLGIVSVNQGNAHFALDYYLTGLQICRRYQLIEEAELFQYNIGALYFKYHEYAQARKYFTGSMRLRKKSERHFYTKISIASCYLEEGNLKKAKEYWEAARVIFMPPLDEVTQLYLWCFCARFAHRQKNLEEREYYIEKITDTINKNIPIMEIFEDLYMYCGMLLETEHYLELQKMIQTMGQVVEQADILHLRMRLLELKIGLYKKTGEQQSYMATTAVYYELGRLAEQEKRYVINTIMGVQFSLEEEKMYSHEMEERNKILQRKSEMDPLTGLSNRFRLNEYAEKAFQNATVERDMLAIEIFDIDYFKEYNDNYGHQRGDECLIKMADVLKKFTISEKIFCARYGGDEFILIYEKSTKEEVQSLAEQLKQEIAKLNIEHKFSNADNKVTISQGICIGIPREGQKVWDYLYQADKMLYEVKKKSRNAIAFCENQGEDTGTE